MTEPAVAVHQLRKVFPIPFRRAGVVAVRGLSLEVAPGQIYGLLGPNGSGKSTTLKIILGLISPTSGTTKIFGRDSREVRSREGVGFLPENAYFYTYLTGFEMLRFYGKLCGMPGSRLRARIDELLELVGLTTAQDRPLSAYSKGMLQRIGLAQALIHEPRLLVLDEPTAGVDPAGSRDIRDLILELKRRGITVLLSSHLLGQVEEVCDRVGILANGALVREGALEELLTVADENEYVLRNAPPALINRVATLATQSGSKLEERRAKKTLEQVFLEATEPPFRKQVEESRSEIVT